MSQDEIARELHVRKARGEKLSGEEQALLAAWYARHDREEADSLGQHSTPERFDPQAHVEATLTQIVDLTQQIQRLSGENAGLRQEIAALQRQLAEKRTAQSA